MAVAYKDIGTAGGVTGTGDTTISLGIPASTVIRDLMVAVIATNGNTRSHTATGWTVVENTGYINVLCKEYRGDSSPITFTSAMGFSYSSGAILTFTGARSTGLSYYSEVETSSWGSTISLPTATVSKVGSGLIFIGTVINEGFTGTISSILRGTKRYDSDIDGNSYNPMIATEDNVLAFGTVNNTITMSSAASTKYGQIIVIPPFESCSCFLTSPLLSLSYEA